MKAWTTVAVIAALALPFALSSANVGRAAGAPNGAALYNEKCAMCHAANGQGLPPAFPPLAKNPHVVTNDPHDVIVEILNGMPLTDIVVHGQHYGGGMPAWGNWLSNAEVAAIATYVRSSWGNHASAVTERQVAHLR